MREKRCSTCHVVKPLSAYNRRASAPDGTQARCRDCCRSWYAANHERHRAAVNVRNQRVRLEHQQRLLAWLDGRSCTDCGNEDLRVLDLDHRPGTQKRAAVSELVRQLVSWAVVLEELDKCDVRCANCHRIATSERGGYYRESAEAQRARTAADAARRRLALVLGGPSPG